MALASGARLGPYEVVAAIGAGGMGEVYRARDTRLDRTVAIKVLPAALAADPQLRERFEREARAVSSLQHPHICTLFDVGRDGDHDFLVLEYLEGETIADRLARAGAIPPAEALKIAIEICDALDKAHRSGIVHRDLKPANVMLVRSGGASAPPSAKLLDFGLAKAAAPVLTASGLSMLPTTPPNITAQGTILGTFQYMSPEQLEGLEADARTDIFAFGALVFEMLTGRTAFEGKTRASLLGAILKDEPPRVSQVQPLAPRALDRIVATCLAKDPDDRYQSARDLLRDLKWAAASGDSAEAGSGSPARAQSPRLAWIIAAAATLACVGAAIVALQHLRETPVAADAIQFTVAAPTDTTFATPPGGGTGLATQMAIAPNGRQMVFVAGEQGGHRLWLRPLGSVDARPLEGSEGGAFPFWSPDSKYVAFFAGGKLKKLSVAGGPPIVLCDAASGRGGTWNRDNVIVFSPSTNGVLQRVSSAGGIPQSASKLDPQYGESSHRFPSFLPDGRHFLFTGVIGTCCPPAKPGRIRVGSIDSLDAASLAPADSAAQYAAGYVLYQREGTLLATPFDLTSLRFTGDAFPIAERVGFEGSRYTSFSVSPTALVYAGGLSRPLGHLTWMDRSGRALGTIGASAAYFSLALSSNERRVAVALGTSAQDVRDIWILDAQTGAGARFTFGAGSTNSPLWSGDDARVLFQANREGVPGMRLKRVDAAATEELLLSPPAGSTAALTPTDWSKDGRYVIYTRSQGLNGSTDVWALPLEGERKPFAVVETPASETNGTLSPDGKWIAYQAAEIAQTDIFVQPFPPSGGKFQVSREGGYLPLWRADGKELYFISQDSYLMAAPVDTRAPFQAAPSRLFSIATLVAQGAVGRQYAVTKDGRFLVNVFEQQASRTPLTVVVNWIAAIQK